MNKTVVNGYDVLTMTEEEYLGLFGLSSPVSDFMLDKLRLPHGETLRQKRRREKMGEEYEREYQQKRKAKQDEYKRLISDGKIASPTKEEKLIRIANGHPDNEHVQAARRLCIKRGIKWD